METQRDLVHGWSMSAASSDGKVTSIHKPKSNIILYTNTGDKIFGSGPGIESEFNVALRAIISMDAFMPENSLVIIIHQRRDMAAPFSTFTAQTGSAVASPDTVTINIVLEAGAFSCVTIGHPQKVIVESLCENGHLSPDTPPEKLFHLLVQPTHSRPLASGCPWGTVGLMPSVADIISNATLFNLIIPYGAMGHVGTMLRSMAFYGAANPLGRIPNNIMDRHFNWSENAARQILSTRTYGTSEEPASHPRFLRSFKEFAFSHCISGAGEAVFLLEAGRRLRKEKLDARWIEAPTDNAAGLCDTYIVTFRFPQAENYKELLQNGLAVGCSVKVFFTPPPATGEDAMYMAGTVLNISLPSAGALQRSQRMVQLQVRRPQLDSEHPNAALVRHVIDTQKATAIAVQPFDNFTAMKRRYQMTGHLLTTNPQDPGRKADLAGCISFLTGNAMKLLENGNVVKDFTRGLSPADIAAIFKATDGAVRDKCLQALRRVPYAKLCIQGPAGTGKTDLVSMIVVMRLLAGEKKILATSYSNVAINNMKARVLGHIMNHKGAFMRLRGVPIVVRHFSLPVEAEQALVGCLGGDWTTSPSTPEWTPEFSPAGHILSLLYPHRFAAANVFERASRQKLRDGMDGARLEYILDCARAASAWVGSVTDPSYITRISSLRRALHSLAGDIVSRADIIFTNVDSAAQQEVRPAIDDVSFVVVDEAACMPVGSVLAFWRGQDIVLAGDIEQLEPVVTRKDGSTTDAFINPLFQFEMQSLQYYTMAKLSWPTLVLDRQRRMQPGLWDVVAPIWYGLQPTMDSRAPVTELPNAIDNAMCQRFKGLKACPSGRVYPCFIKVAKTASVVANATGSRTNARQWEVTAQVVDLLLTSARVDAAKLVVLVPYRAQAQLGQADFATRGGGRFSDVRVRTVNKFRGAEADVVIYTMVVTRSDSNSMFTIDPRRVLVALTRASAYAIIIGDPPSFPELPRTVKFERLIEGLGKEGRIHEMV